MATDKISDFISYSEAEKLVDEAYSCMKKITTRKHVTLSPKWIGCVAEGIREQLNRELKLYSVGLEGIPISYNKPRCVQKAAGIIDENPYMHLDVELDYVIFQPTVDSLLKGYVNKKSEDHIGCLVHRMFNASIHRPRHIASAQWVGNKYQLQDEVMFKVTKLHTQSGVASLKGKLYDESAETNEGSRKRKHSAILDCTQGNNDSFEETYPSTSVSESDQTPAKRKKKKKHKDTEDVSLLNETNSPLLMPEAVKQEVADGVSVSERDTPQAKKAKKKKKHRDMEGKSTTIEANVSEPLLETVKQENIDNIEDTEKERLSIGSVDSGIALANTSLINECDGSVKKHKKKKSKNKKKDSDDDIFNGSLLAIKQEPHDEDSNKTPQNVVDRSVVIKTEVIDSIDTTDARQIKKKKKHKKNKKDHDKIKLEPE